jgi:histidinol-phosphate/aromatic aminotransferase/cobyric acid decarboxylase-like protein
MDHAPDALAALRHHGDVDAGPGLLAIRRGGTFPGLGPDHVRVAVRPAEQAARSAGALAEVTA